MKSQPPHWADRFLEWYCNPALLEQIQGDLHELYRRQLQEKGIRKANISFAIHVMLFFRWRNIRRNHMPHYSTGLLKNTFIVAIRNYRRNPGTTLLNLAGLSVAFTCSLLILLWAHHEFSFDTFHRSPAGIYKVLTNIQADGSYQTFDAASVSMDLSSIPEIEYSVSVSSGSRWPHELCFKPVAHPEECVYQNGIYAGPQFFSVFDFPMVKGVPDLKSGSNIVISETMARNIFGDEEPVGKTIKIDGFHEAMITGVFRNVPVNSSLQFDFVFPFTILKKQWGNSDDQFNHRFFSTYIRSSKGSGRAETLTSLLNQPVVLTPDLKDQNASYLAYPFINWHLRSKFEGGVNTGGRIEYVWLFLIAGILVVVIASINYVNLATARATLRAKEIGIRKVTGAVRSSITSQFLGESFLLLSGAFVLALLLTQWSLPFFSTLVGDPIQLKLQGSVPFMIAGILIFISIAAGLYPAMVMSSFQPVRILKNQITASGNGRLRQFLMMIQLGVSICIIIFSVTVYLQLNFITNKDLGFDRENTLRIEPTYRLFTKINAFKEALLQNPLITHVAAASSNPLSLQAHNTGVNWPGKPGAMQITFQTVGCSYEFPETIGLKILDGENFHQKPVDSVRTEALVTESAVRIMGLDKPVGTTITIGDATCTIIGVVNDFHTESLHEAVLPVILFQVPYVNTSAIYIKYQAGTTQESLEAVQKAYQKLEPDFTMRYWFQDETFDDLYKSERSASKLMLLFTFIALVIATMGVAGLAAFNADRKMKEISIRRIFGATASHVLVLLTSEFFIVLTIALAVALPVTWYFTQQWLGGFAYHINVPWWIYGMAYSGIAILTGIVIYLMGIRAITTSPAEILRSE